MKKLFLLLLLTSGMYAQKQVFNIQQYQIDEKPFNKGKWDITGNEYSFIFLDTQKSEVVFFLTNQKIKYQIVDEKKTTAKTTYTLKNEFGLTEMNVNAAKNRIEFNSQDQNIVLKVGKSTKM